MTRLCATLLSEPAFQQVLTVNRLVSGPEKSGLTGVATKLYDMLNIDVTLIPEVPASVSADDDRDQG